MFDDEVDAFLKGEIEKIKPFALQEAKNQTPIAGGVLVSSIRIRDIPNGFEIIWGNSQTFLKDLGFGYEFLVANGTRPHVITAKNAKVLTNGSKFFGKKVNHPGTKANPFDVRTFQSILNKLD